MSSMTDKAVEQAKVLAPWHEDLPWWGLLVEGLLAVAAALFLLFFPNESARNAGMLGVAALGVWGLLQFWWLLRHKFNESIDQWAAARGGIAIFAALLFYLMYFNSVLPINIGLIILGVTGLAWALLGIPMVVSATQGSRMGILLDSLIFGLVGAAAAWVLFQGPAVISTVTTIITWVLLIGGAILLLMAFLRRRDVGQEKAQFAAATAAPAKAVPAATAPSTAAASRPATPTAPPAAPAAPKSVSEMSPEELDRAMDNLKRTTPTDPTA